MTIGNIENINQSDNATATKDQKSNGAIQLDNEPIYGK